MDTLVSRQAPDFKAQAVLEDDQIKEVKLSNYKGKYVILFFYPFDFSFICPTEIIAFNKRLQDFKKRDCEIIGASTDSVYTHLAWKNAPQEEGGIGKIDYPLISDLDRNISRNYGVLSDESYALRGWFLIDRHGIVRHSLINDDKVGRNVEEALRTLDAVRFSDENEGVCPANWHEGDETLKMTGESVSDYLSRHGGEEA